VTLLINQSLLGAGLVRGRFAAESFSINSYWRFVLAKKKLPILRGPLYVRKALSGIVCYYGLDKFPVFSYWVSCYRQISSTVAMDRHGVTPFRLTQQIRRSFSTTRAFESDLRHCLPFLYNAIVIHSR